MQLNCSCNSLNLFPTWLVGECMKIEIGTGSDWTPWRIDEHMDHKEKKPFVENWKFHGESMINATKFTWILQWQYQSFAMLSTWFFHGFHAIFMCNHGSYMVSACFLHAVAMVMVSPCLLQFQFSWEIHAKFVHAETVPKALGSPILAGI